MGQHTLVIVTGAQCAGKSSVARPLAELLSLPLVAKDAIKEQLFDSLGIGDREWSKRLSRASFDLIYQFARLSLESGQSCVVEGNFKPLEETKHFLDLIKATRCRVVQIYCYATAEAVRKRHAERAGQQLRHPGHIDHLYDPDEIAQMAIDGTYAPLDLHGRLIEIETSGPDAADIDVLLTWIGEEG